MIVYPRFRVSSSRTVQRVGVCVGGWVVVLIVSDGWWVLAGAGCDGFCAVFAGYVDPSVVALAAEGWLLGFWVGFGVVVGCGVVEPAFGVEPGGWVGDVGGVLWAGLFVVGEGCVDGGGVGFFEGGFPSFAGCSFADFAGVGVPEGFESVIFR